MNRILAAVFAAVLAPLGAVGPWLALGVLSLVTAVVMLLVFRLVSNQAGIRRAKARVVGQLLAIRLFKDDPWMTVRGLGGALRENLGYLRHALFPLLVMMVPVGLILVHLDPWFARTPLQPGAVTRVAVVVAPGADRSLPAVELHPSDTGAYRVETPPLRIPSLGEIDWRVRVEGAGSSELRFSVDGKTFAKELVAGTGMPRVNAVRSRGLLGALLYPGEPTLEGAPAIREVVVDYPAREFTVLGLSMPWWLAFFLLTLVLAFLLKKPLRVEA
ncbi:MAG: hypothetical protein JXQ29_13125 [Planctomycetes bacterium]|nr:hypothetical protein [Planctomycetota bacterium]